MTSPTQEVAVRSDRPAPTPPAVTGGRGRKPGIPPKERPDIPADEFQVFALPEKQKADLRRKREDRKPQQLAVDAIVYEVFGENVALHMDHGTIADWADLFVYDWPVSKKHAENAIFLINKGCRLYNRRPIWGEQKEYTAKDVHEIDSPDSDESVSCPLNGREHVHIPFSVVRRPRRSASAE